MNSPPKSAASSSSGLPLRQLRWRALPPVDVLDECHWLVTLDARNANRARKTRQGEHHKPQLPGETPTKELSDLYKQKSPYRQPLRRPKPPAPSPGSPAQRAAKSILKLKEGLSRLDGTNRTPETHDETHDELIDTTIDGLAQQHVHQQTSTSRLIDPSLKDNGPILRVRSPSPSKAKTLLRSPSRKKKKRPPTREERDLAEKQARLETWLKANPDASPANSIENGARAYDMSSLYSIEVSARIESTMQCRGPLESGVRLWDDPVRSLLAAEMTSESVFGGQVPTRALAFQSPQAESPPRATADAKTETQVGVSPPKLALVDPEREEQLLNAVEPTIAGEHDEDVPAHEAKPQLSEHARKVFNAAHRQAADGDVADALATLEDGIRQSLSTSQAHLDAASGSNGVGFNYSALAHASATKLQLCYRSRHRRRVNRLIFLQRQWRWWHARRRVLSSVQYAHTQAMVIQRRYRPWYRHITQVRSAVRIQRCFRVFESQKFTIRFRQVCRLLLARKARRWRLKTRMWMVGKWVLLWRRQRRRIALVQGLWRRLGARAQLETLLAQVQAVERERRAREDEFVAAKLDKARLCFREFLTSTRRGRELVRWQAEKPWLRFRRLRNDTRQWDELPLSKKIDAVARVLPGRSFRGLHQRALCQMLVGKSEQLPALPKLLKVSVEELGLLAAPVAISDKPKLIEAVGCCACCPWLSSVRDKLKQTHMDLSRRAATLWWSLATYPKEYCAARIWHLRKRRRDQARQQLEDDCARLLATFLRVWFRRIDIESDVPPYSCEWCSEAFGTSREYFAHGKCGAARARAKAEWTELSSDVKFSRRNKWRLWRQSHTTPVRQDIRAFDLDAASVRSLRRTGSHRKALQSLVATLEVCTTDDNSDAVIPLDLAGFVLQYLDDDRESHPLLQTAEKQLLSCRSIGSSELASRWIRKDELRSRLLVGSNWRGGWNRWQRYLVKYQRQPTPRVDNALSLRPKAPRTAGSLNRPKRTWQALQLQMRRLIPGKRKAAQHLSTSSAVAGSRVLPVAT
ncbi:hypothetical protein PRIC1_004268 [Phytophthora ramorum]